MKPELIDAPPVRLQVAGEPPKLIEDFAGRAFGGEERVSIARVWSPAGWSEPGQRPEFDEFTVVIAGTLSVEGEDGASTSRPSRASSCTRASGPATPRRGPEYVASACWALSPETVQRDEGAG